MKHLEVKNNNVEKRILDIDKFSKIVFLVTLIGTFY